MKKHRSNDIMTSDISFKKVSGRHIQPPARGEFTGLYVLYIIYISNGNNVMMSLAFICRPFTHDIILTLLFLRRLCHPRHPQHPFSGGRHALS
jgi:hypothetical protein